MRAGGDRPDRVRFYFRREWKPLALVTVTGLLYNVGLGAGPLFEGKLAQCLLEVLRGQRDWPAMARLAALYVAVTAFVQAARYAKRFYVRRFDNSVNRRMKAVLYAGLLRRQRPELMEESTGSLLTRAISDVDACVEGMRKFTTEVFDTGVVMVVYVGMLLAYDWRLTLLACLFPPAAFFLAERMKKPVSRCAAAWKESAGWLNEATLDRVSGAVTYRVFGLEEKRDEAYEERLADYERRAVAAHLWEGTMQPLYHALSMAGALMIVWLGSRNVLGTGWVSWDIAAFTTFLACFTKLSVKVSKTAKLFNAVQKAQVSWGRVKPLLEGGDLPEETAPAAPQTLEVEDLTFAYPQGETVLRDVTFTAVPGQIVGVAGPVACGKSTLGKAFLCEYPYQGSIRFGGKELRDMTAAERTGVVGYLGHQPELLGDSVRENVLLGSPGSPEPWLRAVCLEDEVAAMPDGAETQVGSGGIRLSGGQQARLALARTLCHRRPVLILDDPFSAVDRTTEVQIMEHLETLAGDGIVLLLSHRLDLFDRCDQVIWMEEGRCRVGTHRELLETCGGYARAFLAQKGGSHEGE